MKRFLGMLLIAILGGLAFSCSNKIDVPSDLCEPSVVVTRGKVFHSSQDGLVPVDTAKDYLDTLNFSGKFTIQWGPIFPIDGGGDDAKMLVRYHGRMDSMFLFSYKDESTRKRNRVSCGGGIDDSDVLTTLGKVDRCYDTLYGYIANHRRKR
jgi:hypothetical protein